MNSLWVILFLNQPKLIYAHTLQLLSSSIPGRVISKTQKIVLDASLLNTQHYKVHFKGKVEQSRKRNSILPHTLV